VDEVTEDARLERATLRLINAAAFLAGTRAHSRRLRAVTGVDLGPSDVRFIELLSGLDAVPTSVVARGLGVDLAQASRQATQLEAAGHIVRRTDPDDRRRTLLALSAPTAAMLDEWLLAWSGDYLDSIARWNAGEVAALTEWFKLVHDRLVAALPDRPRSAAADRWLELAAEDHDRETRAFLHTMISLTTWVSQSRGFNDLLERLDAPVRQSGFSALQVVQQSGPLSIVEIAERLAIDPSQASKRLRQLTELRLVDRAVDGFDRRSSLIRLSRKGAALLAKVAEEQLATFEEMTEDISRADRLRWTPLVEAYIGTLLTRRVSADGVLRSAGQELFSRR